MFGYKADHEERIKQTGFEVVLPALQAVGTVASAVAGIKSLTSGSKTPAMPAIEKPATMPAADDEAMRKARRRSLAATQARSGRLSTIMSDVSDDPLGA